MSFCKWMCKQTVLHTGNGILFNAKKINEISNHIKIFWNLKFILLSERSQSEMVTYCVIPTIWHSEKGETIETVKRSMVPRDWNQGLGEGWISKEKRIFTAVKPFYMILYWWMHVIIHLSKPIECTLPKVKHNVCYGLWVIVMCECRSTSWNKPLMEALVNGRGDYACLGAQSMWENSLPPSQFCCETKAALT